MRTTNVKTSLAERRKGYVALVLGAVLIFALAVAGASTAPGFDVNADGFAIDEDLQDNLPLEDWETAITPTGGLPVAPFYGPGVISDELYSRRGMTDSTHFAGGDKFLDPAGWEIITKNGGSAQTELRNAYIVARNDAAGNPIVYVGFVRDKEEGDFHLDVEFNGAAPTAAGAPVRVAGDFAVIVDILKNPVDGGDLHLEVIRFPTPTSFTPLFDIDLSGVASSADLEQLYNDEGAIAVMNSADIAGDFNNFYIDGNENWVEDKFVEEFTFVEMAVDLAQLGIEPACPGFASVHLKSRSSDAVNSDLKDLVGPEPIDLSTCGSKTFTIDFGDQGPIGDLRYYAVLDDHQLASPDTDAGKAGDLSDDTGAYELTDENGYSVDFGTVAPGTLYYHYEARASDGSTIVLSTPANSETIGRNEDVTNDASFAYALSIDDDQVNEVGQAETFTATLTGELCDLSGDAPACADSALPGVSVSHTVDFSIDAAGTSATPSPQITDSSGQVQITVNSPIAQVASISASVASAGATGTGASASTSKRWVEARLGLTPPYDANQVGTDHLITAHLEFDYGDGNGFVDAPAGETINFAIDSGPGSLVASSCSTDGSGECAVTLQSALTGLTTVSASWSGNITTTEGTTAASASASPVDKRWVDARLTLSPAHDANQVGTDHLITAHLEFDYGDGAGFGDAPAGETINLAIDSGPGTLVASSCSTEASGMCSVTLQSAATGLTTVSASWSGSIATAEGSASASASASPIDKRWVNAQLTLSPAHDANQVGTDHLITAHLEFDYGDGAGFDDAPAGETINFAIDSGPGSLVASSCSTDASGMCSVTLQSAATGLTTVSASWSGSIATAEGTASASASASPIDKRWVNASIALTPADDRNGIGEPHELVATLTFDYGDGSGFVAAPDGEIIDLATDFGYFDAAMTQQTTTCTTAGGAGACTAILYSDVAGTANITASWSGTIATAEGNAAATAGPATAAKTYIDGSLRWFKVDGEGNPLLGATFAVQRVADRAGNDVTEDPIIVVDNGANDNDSDPGVFELIGLPLGTYTIAETDAPPGYRGDLDRVETVQLTLDAPDATIAEPWVNTTLGRLTPTGTTCQDFVSGVAADFTDVFYGTKDGLINNTHPGVFFYYTQVEAPSASFDVDIVQTADDANYLFNVQNLDQVRLYDANCSTLPVDFTVTDGLATIHISGATAGQIFIISVKYETGNVVGMPVPGTIHYDFMTEIAGEVVDFDEDGLYLRPNP